jgi:hypothetical protein
VVWSPLIGAVGLTLKPEGGARGVSPAGPGSVAAKAGSPKGARTRVEQTRKPEKAAVAYRIPLAVAHSANYGSHPGGGEPE